MSGSHQWGQGGFSSFVNLWLRNLPNSGPFLVGMGSVGRGPVQSTCAPRRYRGMPSNLFKRLLRCGLPALLVTLAVPAVAAADAPDITSAAGSVSSDGKTVTINGSWAWTTHHSDCNTDRAGV